jgi:hypothetical protein
MCSCEKFSVSTRVNNDVSKCNPSPHLTFQMCNVRTDPDYGSATGDLVELTAMRKEADGVKPGTVNRHLAVIKTILRTACFEWDWTDKVPKIRMQSWHAQAGTPLSVIQELGGWRSAVMVQRYAHLTAGHLVNYANNIVRDTSSTKLAHVPITKVEN